MERLNWLILQRGELPLRPGGGVRYNVEHRCTSVLVWPEHALPVPSNTVMVDPCFTDAGYNHAVTQLEQIGASFEDIGYVFVTHLHHDHMLHLPYDVAAPRFRPFRPDNNETLPGLTIEHCPGHDPMLLALAFRAPDDRRVWLAADAVLDDEWLRAWDYYWLNGYSPDAVIETWRSVAKIVAGADVIVPGHGGPIDVTADLVRGLIAAFPTQAHHADACPDVLDVLRARLAELGGA
jgi:glyoxylase-like metal-dependent hydrolase (beta-lactamase superfamily II)